MGSAEKPGVCVEFHVKFYDSEPNFSEVGKKLVASKKVRDGKVKFSETFKEEEIGFGIKKLIITGRVESFEAGDLIAEQISEALDDDTQTWTSRRKRGRDSWEDTVNSGSSGSLNPTRPARTILR